jgi:hypothetical protein
MVRGAPIFLFCLAWLASLLMQPLRVEPRGIGFEAAARQCRGDGSAPAQMGDCAACPHCAPQWVAGASALTQMFRAPQRAILVAAKGAPVRLAARIRARQRAPPQFS